VVRCWELRDSGDLLKVAEALSITTGISLSNPYSWQGICMTNRKWTQLAPRGK